VTAVSELGFGGRAYNTSAGAFTPTGCAAVMDESDPAIMATNGTMTPGPTIFFGTAGPAGNGTVGGSNASATGKPTSATPELLVQDMLAKYAGLVIPTLVTAP
jgi:hypothetical protein